MNIVILLAGGIGKRFGATIPKQYTLVAGKPMIDYVIDAIRASEETDKTIVVMDRQWINYSEKLSRSDFDFAPHGLTRCESLYQGLAKIHENYTCEKVVVVDAVRPFITGQIIDDYFHLLDRYDAVITAEQITGALTDVHDRNLDRNDYIITQSPEGFRFDLLWASYDRHFPYQETAGMLPKGSRRYYNWDFRNNLKITYDFEIFYAESLLRQPGNADRSVAFFDKNILLTGGIRNFFLRTREKETLLWLDQVYSAFPELVEKWGITSFVPNQIARYGLVLHATSKTHGEIILKFTPEFINRFEREAEAYQILPRSYMCEVIDIDTRNRCLILRKIQPARYASFEDNLKLTVFFEHVFRDAVKYTGQPLSHIGFYQQELKQRCEDPNPLRFHDREIREELQFAWELYNRAFREADLYILHGDLIDVNVLDDGTRYYGVDPIGFIAPIELECVRFIRNDVRNHPEFGYRHRFDILISSFSRFVNRTRLIQMFIIDMAYCTYNSVFENDTPDETEVDLELIRIARECLET
ncbi:MAG: 2-C-methyl-D-erythritol 4-phosphate cytidylyltransferase [Clostridia bacterium]|nr:2-C-methyl-D-erythritol 4-phosphate cytidylyltransferase [Clostridia bacterium]